MISDPIDGKSWLDRFSSSQFAIIRHLPIVYASILYYYAHLFDQNPSKSYLPPSRRLLVCAIKYLNQMHVSPSKRPIINPCYSNQLICIHILPFPFLISFLPLLEFQLSIFFYSRLPTLSHFFFATSFSFKPLIFLLIQFSFSNFVLI